MGRFDETYKLFNIKYEFQTGKWTSGAAPSKLVVSKSLEEATQKVRDEYSHCEWVGGSEVKVDGYEVFVKPLVHVYDELLPKESEADKEFNKQLSSLLLSYGKENGHTFSEEEFVFLQAISSELRTRLTDFIYEKSYGKVNLAKPIVNYKEGDNFLFKGEEKLRLILLTDMDRYGLLQESSYRILYTSEENETANQFIERLKEHDVEIREM